jgi:hypothetical protein
MNKGEKSPILRDYKEIFVAPDLDSLRQVRAKMLSDFKQSQMKMELEMYWDKKVWAEDSAFWQWFGASRERTALFHLFNLQGYPDGWTNSMIADYLQRDRSAVTRELTECQQNGFIYRNPQEGKQRYFLPSERLISNGDWYAEYYVDLVIRMNENNSRRLFNDYRTTEKKHIEQRAKK